jgi:NAD(P)-dependent dehydrogenase (short-subunit alcohol dehydrogenase family)
MVLSNHYPSLKNKVIFITGGASGIGASLVEAFCCQGARVAFVDILEEEAQRLVTKITALENATCPDFFPCDLTRTAELQNVISRVEKQIGTIGVLLNNAASDARHDFRTISEDYWNNRIQVNLRHAFFAVQAVYPGMKSLGGGSIINFGSMSWYECQGNMTGYTTSKAALEGMTRGLARDLGQDNIRINTLIPGWVMTERQLRDWVNEDTLKDIQRSQCLKNPLMPEDICAMALFLASDDSKMCTAQNFIVDGGWI